MAAKVDFTHDEGTSFLRVLTIKNDASVVIDLTGYTFAAKAFTKLGAAAPSFEFDFVVRTQTGGDIGKVDMKIAPASTSDLNLTKSTGYVYDVVMTSAGGEISKIFGGTITVVPTVSE